MLDQHDRKVWALLLESLVAKGDWEEARKVGESAMFVDVASFKTHRLYARALARTGRFLSAIYELNSALLCKAKPAERPSKTAEGTSPFVFVVQVLPFLSSAVIATAALRSFGGDEAANWQRFIERQPMGRLGEPDEIAALALYLASDESAFTTGTVHVVDGGWSN